MTNIENLIADEDEEVIVSEDEEIQEEETEEEADLEEEEQEAEDEEQEEEFEDEEFVVMDVNGVNYQLPKGVEKAIMQERDYTQGKQAIAEERRAIEQEREELKAQAQRDKEDFELQSRVLQVDENLKQYENVNWDQLEAEDPDNAARHWRQYQMLRDRKGDLQTQVTERQTQRSQELQQIYAKRFEETQKFATENIPNWSADLANSLEAYAKELGYTDSEITNNLSPQFLKALHSGYLGSQVKKGAAKAVKKKSTVQPLKTVKAKSGAKTKRVKLSEASVDAFDKALASGQNPRMSDI